MLDQKHQLLEEAAFRDRAVTWCMAALKMALALLGAGKAVMAVEQVPRALETLGSQLGPEVADTEGARGGRRQDRDLRVLELARLKCASEIADSPPTRRPRHLVCLSARRACVLESKPARHAPESRGLAYSSLGRRC